MSQLEMQKSFEKSLIYRQSHDGTLDMFMGLMLVKFMITTPRLGYVKMKSVKGGRKTFLRRFLVFSFTVTILLLAASIFKIPLVHNQPISISPVIEFLFLLWALGFVGWLIGLYSLIFVGLAAGIGWPIARMIDLDTVLGLPADLFTLGIPGLAIAVLGLIRYIKFLRENPLPKNSQQDESN